MKLYVIDWRYNSPRDNYISHYYIAETERNKFLATTIRLVL